MDVLKIKAAMTKANCIRRINCYVSMATKALTFLTLIFASESFASCNFSLDRSLLELQYEDHAYNKNHVTVTAKIPVTVKYSENVVVKITGISLVGVTNYIVTDLNTKINDNIISATFNIDTNDSYKIYVMGVPVPEVITSDGCVVSYQMHKELKHNQALKAQPSAAGTPLRGAP